MYSAIQSFGECLSAWMEVKGLTPVSLSQYTRATRDATIARLMHDQLDYQRCARYITELAESELDIDEDTLRRLRRSVDVNRYGKEMYLARQNFLKMITPGEKQAENRPSMAAELCEKLLSWSEGMDINLLCMGLTDAEPLRFLNLISEKKESIQIFHFFDQSHIVELSGLLALTLRLAFKPNYELYQIRDQMGTTVNNIMIARRSDGEHLLIAYDGSVFSTLNISKGTELLRFTLDIMMKRHVSPDKINRRFTHDSRDAYLDFLAQCLKLEKNSPIYHIKSEVGFEYVPTDILCDNFSDWALKFDPDFYPYLDRLREISALRYQNIHEKSEPTYLIMTKEGMIGFAQTGRMKDHPFCLRAFTKDERKKIFQNLLDAILDSTSLIPLFFSSSAISPNHSFIGYGRKCMLICAAQADYNLSDYTEIVLASQELSGQYADFVTNILTKNYVLGKKNGIEFLQSLIRMADEAD